MMKMEEQHVILNHLKKKAEKNGDHYVKQLKKVMLSKVGRQKKMVAVQQLLQIQQLIKV